MLRQLWLLVLLHVALDAVADSADRQSKASLADEKGKNDVTNSNELSIFGVRR